MATATRNTKTETISHTTYQLSLSQAEAEVLATVLSHVGGAGTHRRTADTVLYELIRVLGEGCSNFDAWKALDSKRYCGIRFQEVS